MRCGCRHRRHNLLFLPTTATHHCVWSSVADFVVSTQPSRAFTDCIDADCAIVGTWYEASKWNRMEWGVRESAKEKKNKREKMILNSVAIIFCFIGSTFIILFLVSCISQCVWRPSNVNFSFVSRTRISNLNGRVFHPPPRVLLRTRGLVHE